MRYIVTGRALDPQEGRACRAAVGREVLLGQRHLGKTAEMAHTITLVELNPRPREQPHETQRIRRLERRPERRQGHDLHARAACSSETQYSFSTRFEEGKGTNPEELIAAAHAGCFTMALSAQLGNADKTAESIETSAEVTLLKTDAGFTITAVHLKVRAKVPGPRPPEFQKAAEAAKSGCPISRVLKAEITMETRLAGWT